MTTTATICIDISGSVGNCTKYWNVVKNIVNDYRQRFETLNYILWDNKCRIITDKSIIDQTINDKIGNGGTDAWQIIEGIKHLGVNDNICIITDGQVDLRSIDKVDSWLKDNNVNNVDCHIISNNPDLSVTCPFTRNNTSKVTTYELSRNVSSVVFEINRQDYEILASLDTISYDNFLENWDKIKLLVEQACRGRESNLTLKTSFVNLKKRMIKEHANRQNSSINDELRMAIQTDMTSAIDICSKLTKDFYSESQNDTIVSKIDLIINMCNGSLRHSFNPNDVKSASFQSSKEVQPQEQPKEFDSLPKIPFDCPISYDSDVPCILIKWDQDILTHLTKDQTESIQLCPLRIMFNDEAMQKIRKCIQHSVGLKTIPNLDGINPFTREPFDGFICLSNEIKFNDYQLANMISQGKRFGNMDLWLWVIYSVAKTFPFLQEIIPQFENHIKWRFSQTTSYASLNGLGILPTTMLETDLCCYYILSSYDYIHSPKHDTLRFHLSNVEMLKDIVKLCFGKYENKSLDKYIEKLRFMMHHLEFCKKGPQQARLQNLWKQAFYQNALFFENNVVLLDGPANLDEHPLKSCLTGNQMWGILEDISPQVKSSDIHIKTKYVLPKHVVNWPYDDKYIERMKSYRVPISPKTFRQMSSYKDIDGNIITWKESCKKYYEENPDSRECFKASRYFVEYIILHAKVPTLEEYCIFSFAKVTESGTIGKTTLPFCIRECYDSVMEDYKEVFRATNYTIEEIARLMEQSRTSIERMKMEN